MSKHFLVLILSPVCTYWVNTINHYVCALTAGWGDVNVRFLCGADLLESFSVPGLWAEKDVSMQ